MIDEHPDVAIAYEALRAACDANGPLDAQVLALVKLAVSVGAGLSRTTHIHAKKALTAGVAPEAIRQIAFAALPTIGLPRALDALDWIEESVVESGYAVGSAERVQSPGAKPPAESPEATARPDTATRKA
jgi:alkylhydroperoxidase/carboxymuconolactone decarboxylase family protein YurZ